MDKDPRQEMVQYQEQSGGLSGGRSNLWRLFIFRSSFLHDPNLNHGSGIENLISFHIKNKKNGIFSATSLTGWRFF